MDFIVNPWETKGKIDYSKLMKEFGISPMPKLPRQFQENLLFRRKIVFSQRNFGNIIENIKNKKKFVMMTGLMPSGKFHFGHAMVFQQILFYQSIGAKIYLAVADIEAYNTRNTNMDELHKTAIGEYLINYIAMGLSPKNCDFYFQSKRSNDGKKASAYYKLANIAARHITFNEVKAAYGDVTPGKLASSLLQISDMLHPQLEEFDGPIPVIVPAGADQDVHVRIAHDVINRIKINKFMPLSSTYNMFMPGLKGEKMSSSDQTSYIALTDTPEEAAKKIRRYAFSGGQATIEEHRKKGGNPDVDVSYQYLRMFFEPNDKKLEKIYYDYKSGKLLTGELKEILIEKVGSFLKKHQKNRERAKKDIDKFLLKN